jgi:hypothetical protein
MEFPCFACFDWNAIRNIHDIKLFKRERSKDNMERKFFERKGITWIFAVIAVFSGFLFLDSGVTGNVIVNKQSTINLVSIIGLLLIVCSTILIAYSVKKK